MWSKNGYCFYGNVDRGERFDVLGKVAGDVAVM